MASYNQLTWNPRKKKYGAPLVPDMTTVQDELKNNLNDKYQNICFGLFYSSTHRQKMCHFQKNIFIFYQIMHKIIIMYYYDIFNFRGVCSDHVTAWCIMGRAFFSRTRAFSHEPGHFSHEPGHFLTNSGIIMLQAQLTSGAMYLVPPNAHYNRPRPGSSGGVTAIGPVF